MTDKLDSLIETLKETASLSAEGMNALSFAQTHHPLCKGKTVEQRKAEVLFAVAGRGADATAVHRIERLTTA